MKNRSKVALATIVCGTLMTTSMAFAQMDSGAQGFVPLRLSTEDVAALKAAREAKDVEAVMAILEKNGLNKPFVKMENVRKQGEKKHGEGMGMQGMKKPGEMMEKMKEMSEEDKAALKAAHEAKDYEKVKEIMKKYGIEKPEGKKGEHMEEHKEMKEEMKKKIEAMSAEDKSAWETAHKNKDIAAIEALMKKYGIEKPENWEKHKAMMEKMASMSAEDKAALEKAKEEKNKDAIEAIMKKYGIEKPEGMGEHMGKGEVNKPPFSARNVLDKDSIMSAEDKAALLKAIQEKDGDAAKTILDKYRK